MGNLNKAANKLPNIQRGRNWQTILLPGIIFKTQTETNITLNEDSKWL